VNLLAADGIEGVDTVTSMAHLTGILVDVSKAAGPKSEREWSGI